MKRQLWSGRCLACSKNSLRKAVKTFDIQMFLLISREAHKTRTAKNDRPMKGRSKQQSWPSCNLTTKNTLVAIRALALIHRSGLLGHRVAQQTGKTDTPEG
ncbi:hypothetical protein ACUN9Y_08430 [Halomonas sp. V046]|uniref:hypothetical protein n=1 Tax=Halomonas sp. V046 TaxID=3459611 RepID=UPI004044BEA4